MPGPLDLVQDRDGQVLVENEVRLLSALTADEQDRLAALLRKLLIDLGDTPPTT